jgi:hypothetical protein
MLPERNVSSNLVVIDRVFRKNSAQVLCAEHDQMIGALAPDRANQAFSISILPWRAERGGPVPNTHRSHARLERDAEGSVIVANEIFRYAVLWKCLGDLTSQPLGRRIAGHRKPQQPPSFVPENQKCE